METILSSFFAFVLLYKYAGLFLIAFIAALALPIPASATLAAAGAFAAQGYFNIAAVVGVALAGNVLGDHIGYFFARRYGETTLSRMGFGRLLRNRSYRMLKGYILDVPQSLIYFTRFVTEVGPTVNVLAGLAAVPYTTFLFFDVFGEMSYVLLYALTGYFLGSQWENNAGFLASGVVVLLSLGGMIILIQTWVYRRHARHRTQKIIL